MARAMLQSRDMRKLFFALLLGSAACAGTGTVAYTNSGSYGYADVDMVTVSPGVQVIADYDEPVFYSGGYYWRQSGDIWYRSNNWTGGWGVYNPPRAVVNIRSPNAYVRYRPHGYVERRPARAYRDRQRADRNRNRGPEVRDHRR
jgi:hypothetical protein